MNYKLLIVLFTLLYVTSTEKTYNKTYYDNGSIKQEGWMQNNQKVDYWKFYSNNGSLKKEGHFLDDKEVKYWYFYHTNGIKKSEGHFINGGKNNWWIFYDDTGEINNKCQLKNNFKNGYRFQYKNKKIIKAEKYKAGKKIKEWTDIKSFKKENNLRDLK